MPFLVSAGPGMFIPKQRFCVCSIPISDMAPHPGIDTDQIKEKARTDLLDLLKGVCKA